MRNSDKLARLASRRATLIGAIKNNTSEDKMSKYVERVRNAVLIVLKKHREQIKPYSESTNSSETKKRLKRCDFIEEKWHNMSTNDLINVASQWPDNPSLRDIGVIN